MVLLLYFDGVNTSYSPADHIEILNASKFKSRVLSDRAFWVVLFYVPSCKYCAQLEAEYKKLATMPKIKGHIKVGVFDIAKDKEIVNRYKIDKVPTILFFGANKSVAPKTYTGARTAKALAQAILADANKG